MRNRAGLVAVSAVLAISAASTAADEKPAVASFPTFGISFTAPAKSTFQLTDSPSHIGLYGFGTGSPCAGAAILVEIMPANGKDVEAVSADLSDKMKVKFDAGTLKIGGEKAKRVSADFKAGPFTHRVTYVVVHQDRAYVLSALNTPAADASEPLKKLADSVKFVPAESPLKHLNDLFDAPVEVFGLFSFNGPDSLRRTDNTAELLHLQVFDHTTKSDPLNVDFEHIQTGDTKSFADIRDAYSQKLQQSMGFAEALVWKQSKDVKGLQISQPVKMTTKLPDGKTDTSTQRFCMLEIAPGDFVQILFSISKMPDADLKTYVAATDRMLSSIKILPKRDG